MSQIIVDLDDDPQVISEVITFLQSFTREVIPASEHPEITTPLVDGDSGVSAPAAGEPDPKVIFGAGKAVNPHVTPSPDDVVTPIPTTPVTPAAELDSAGYPWDKRIHAGTKTKKNDGTWKLRKGVDKELVTQVQAEFTASIIPGEPSHGSSGGQTYAELMAAPPVTPVGTTDDVTWPVVLQKVVAAQNAGTLNEQVKEEFLVANGITGGFPLIANRPDLFAPFLQALGL